MTFRCALTVILACSTLGAVLRGAESRPNIVLILADDMGYECVSANGGESYQTPHLDRLAATGMRFEHGYSQPICTPSRVQIMTGMYNSRNYVDFGQLKPGSYTFANLLRDAGYATGISGKWQLQGGLEAPGKFGFDEYCLWQITRRPNRYPNPGFEIDGREVDFKSGEYGPDIVNGYAREFIRRHARGDKPFFLYYPMMLPHWPFEPTPDSPDWDPRARRNDPVEKSGKEWDPKYFADMVAYVDKMVGNIVTELEAQGVRENTLLIFTGDNGTYESIVSRFQGRDWRGGKGYMTDAGTRAPLIANMPGTVPAGSVNRDLVDFSDFFPTIADFARAKVPASLALDGRSFAAQLRGQPGQPRSYVYCWYFRNGDPDPRAGDPRHQAGESARNHRYKLYRDGGFYDLSQDSDEVKPLEADKLNPEQRQVRAELSRVIERYTRPGFYEQRK